MPYLQHPEKTDVQGFSTSCHYLWGVSVGGYTASKMRLVCVSYKEFPQHVLFVRFTGRYQLQASEKDTTKNHKFILTLPLPTLQNETTNVVINIIVTSS